MLTTLLLIIIITIPFQMLRCFFCSAIRDWVLSAYDVRGAVLEVASRWVGMAYVRALPIYEQQLVALEALQVFAPLGHALGMGSVSSQMEDAALQVGGGHGGAGWQWLAVACGLLLCGIRNVILPCNAGCVKHTHLPHEQCSGFRTRIKFWVFCLPRCNPSTPHFSYYD